MRNAAVLVGMWVGIILFAYSVAYLQSDGLTGVSLSGDVETVDETMGWALPLPVGWSLGALDGVAVLASPIAGVEVWIAAVSEITVEGALAAVWEHVDPCASCERPSVLQSGPHSSGHEGAVVSLAADADGRTGRAVVLIQRDRARVLLFRFARGLTLPARVQSDLIRMEAGFRIVEAEPSAVTPSADNTP